MAKKLKILLVEDDKRFGESLKTLLEKEGFDCMLAEKPQTALAFCKLHTFDIAVIDCMLPQMNGVELALKIKEFFGQSLVLFMMSGIYKDRNFTVSALKKTGAKSFLIKPFQAQELIEQLKEMDKENGPDPILSQNPIKNLILQENTTQNSVYTTLESAKEINGQELPFVFNFLLAFRGTGKLTLKQDSTELVVHFIDNSLSLPALSCVGPKLKSILISRECVAQDDLMQLKPDDTNLDKMIAMNILSPHFGKIISKDHSLEVLNSFVRNHPVSLQFSPIKPSHQAIVLEQKEVDDLIYKWIHLTDPLWLKTYYLPYSQHALKKMSTSQNKTQLFPLVSGNKQILALMMQDNSLEQLLAKAKGTQEETTLRLVHLMMIYREFFIGQKVATTNYSVQIERLQKLLAAFENQNAFERLGLKEACSDQEIKKAYTEISQTLHPDKLKGVPAEVMKLSTMVYEKIQESYNNIKTPDKRSEYLNSIESQKVDKLNSANRKLDEAYNHIMRGDITAADSLISEAAELTPYLPRLKLMQTWSQLKTKKINANDALRNILSVPNEEKESALYLHVRGLCHVALNELDKAMNSFKNALNKDSNFVASRRELSLISQDEKKPSVNILNADLRDVVGLFFNKKPKKK
jgi:DNA-binding response OmpR family regulator/tetratricopeptide (TPR) repeat protein